MLVLVIGTPDSGKSELAEQIACSLAEGCDSMPVGSSSPERTDDPKKDISKYYIATMIPYGEEGRIRVKKHREMRQDKGFVTIEQPRAVDELADRVTGSVVLLECLANLVGNEMHAEGVNVSDDYARENEQLSEQASGIAGEVLALGRSAEHLVIVTNRFPEDDPDYDIDTVKYVRLVHMVNELLRPEMDRVSELEEGEWKESEYH